MEHHLRLAETLTMLLDERFRLGKFSFGLDPLFDFIPGIGNIATFLLSFYLVWIGTRMGLPDAKIREMMRNIITDFILGLIPVVGTIGDFFFKANSKNLKILKAYSPRVVEATVVS